MTKLNQIIAIEKSQKNSINDEVTKVYHAVQKPELLSGVTRTYAPKFEDGDKFPDEKKLVQARASDMLSETARLMTKLFDLTLTKDSANCVARGTVVVNGKTIVSDVPVAHLLFLEKQLTDLATIVKKIPVLDPAESWSWDATQNCYVTEPQKTMKTKKVPRNHVKAEATKEHPAQVEVYHEDVVVGTWTQLKFSGAMPAEKLSAILGRIDSLLMAVKAAREAANNIEVVDRKEGEEIFKFLLG